MLNATHIPVGQDSIAHIEIVQDTARRFNRAYGDVFVVPEGLIEKDRPTLHGTDGRKMSKSFQNAIDVLSDENQIREAVERSFAPLTGQESDLRLSPSDVAITILTAMGRRSEISTLSSVASLRVLLTEILIEEFRRPREECNRLMADPDYLNRCLEQGEFAVSRTARMNLERMRGAMGMS